MIDTWHDRRIGAGQEISQAIDEQINRDDIILLLVSADFLASNYCYDIEVKRAMERHEAGEAIVIPVILRACDCITRHLASSTPCPATASRSPSGRTSTRHSCRLRKLSGMPWLD